MQGLTTAGSMGYKELLSESNRLTGGPIESVSYRTMGHGELTRELGKDRTPPTLPEARIVITREPRPELPAPEPKLLGSPLPPWPGSGH